MSVTIFNVSAQPLVYDHSKPAVQPGDGVKLDDERAEGLLLGPDWSETNPRVKPPRPAKAQPALPDEPTEPAESGDQQEN